MLEQHCHMRTLHFRSLEWKHAHARTRMHAYMYMDSCIAHAYMHINMPRLAVTHL